MKYNTTYTPKISLKDTIIATDKFRKELLTHFKNKMQLIDIMSPTYFLEDDPFALKLEDVTRNITFDMGDEYKVGVLSLSDSTFLREMMRKLELNDGEGLISETATIWRDFNESPVMTPEKHEITIQFFETDDIDLTKKIAREIYDIIFAKAAEFSETFKVENIFPENLPSVSAQSLEIEYPDKDPKTREVEFILEQDAFLFKNPGARLLSGHFHTNIPPMIYDLDDFYQIVLKDRVNSYVLKVVSIAKIALGKKLGEQLTVFGLGDLKQTSEYGALLKDERTIIEIKINLPRLMMALLGKGHISEVQPGVYSAESKSIKSRYKVQTY